MENTAIFPLFYLPAVGYFSSLKIYDFHFILEKNEYFPKQTYRNRALICSPNGPLTLTLPVVKGSKTHTSIKDVKVSYDTRWQRLHWLSLQTCYRSSAYFEFYEDEFVSFYEKKYTFLFDLNLELMGWLFSKLKFNVSYTFSEVYEKPPLAIPDYRDKFLKNSLQNIEFKPYFQVFSDRMPFQPNLSVIDLLFNQGPQSKLYI